MLSLPSTLFRRRNCVQLLRTLACSHSTLHSCGGPTSKQQRRHQSSGAGHGARDSASQTRGNYGAAAAAGCVCAAVLGSSLAYFSYTKRTGVPIRLAAASSGAPAVAAAGVVLDYLEPPARPELPIFSMFDVQSETEAGNRILTTYRNGVYDVTNFVTEHPGGEKILLGAGGSVDRFWAMYAQHKTPDTMAILENLRVGTLAEADWRDKKAADEAAASLQVGGPWCQSQTLAWDCHLCNLVAQGEPYGNEPLRDASLRAHTVRPYNAEADPQLLVRQFYTPNELFYVRNHLPVPKIQTNPNSHTLEISSEDTKSVLSRKPVTLSVAQLRDNFEHVTVVAAIQCAGNRRAHMAAAKQGIKGLSWNETAISNAKWTGVRLGDVLRQAGVDPNDPKNKHVHLWGGDVDPTGQHYGASITISKAFSPETILAFEMNGDQLPVDHGAPLRAVVPGVVGARNVKWLEQIVVSDDESPSHWQQNDYRVYSPSTTWEGLESGAAPSIQEPPVQSAICVPAEGNQIAKGEESVAVHGYAYSGGGRAIVRVEVSGDGGSSWHSAELQQEPTQGDHADDMFAWTLWTAQVPLSEAARRRGKLQLVCRAVDRSYNSQPEQPSSVWNIRGLLNNSWHRVNVLLV